MSDADSYAAADPDAVAKGGHLGKAAAAGEQRPAGEHRIELRSLLRLGASLRWRLTRNRLRKGGLTTFVLVIVVAAFAAIAGFGSLTIAGHAADALQREAVSIAGVGGVLVAWMVLPLMTGGADETLDPTRLALLPFTRRELGTVMFAGAATGPAPLAVFAGLAGMVAGYARADLGSILITLLTWPAAFLLGLSLSRLFGALLATATRSRSGRDIAVMLGTVVFAVVWLGTQTIGPALERADRDLVRRILRPLSWLPIGWPGRALYAASEGRLVAGFGWLAATAAIAAAGLVGWARVTARMLTTSERVVGERSRDGLAPLGRATTAGQAARAKEWRYLRRSPSKRAQLMMTTIMGVGFALVQVLRGSGERDPRIVFAGFVAMVFAIGPAFNIVGFDAGSLWLEDLTGGITRERLRARAMGWLAHALLPGVLGIIAVSAVAGRWSDTVLAIVCLPGLAFGGLGVGAYFSTVTPLPANDGDNPFAWRQGTTGKGCTQGLWMLIGWLTMLVVGAPTVLLAVVFHDRPWAYLFAVAGWVLGGAVFWWMTARGARRLATRGPDLIAELSPRALT